MGIRNGNYGKEVSFKKGVDNTTFVGSDDIVGTLSVGLNTDLVDDSLAVKRSGYVAQNSAWSTRKIRQGFDYKKSNGTRELLLCGEASSVTGTSGILGKKNGTSTPTTITSGLKDGIKPSIVQFRNLCFVFNGQDDFIYDGTTTRQIGITAPVSAASFVSNLIGSLNTSGSYLFTYVYANTSTGAVSSPAPASDILTTTDSLGGIKVQVTAGDSNTANKIFVYRTVSGGNVFFKDGELEISETTYSSTISDGSLGNELELDNSRLSEKALYATKADNRVFVAGFPSNPNRVQYSKIGISGAMPESYQVADFVDCNLNDGDVIKGLGVAGSLTTVLKEKSIGRLVRVDALQGGLERQGSNKYLYEEISTEITGLSGHASTNVDDIFVWLGKDDVYATDGVKIYRLGRRIRNTLKNLNFSQAHKFSAITKPDTQQIIFSVCRAGQTEPDFQLVGHYRNFASTGEIAWTFYSPGTNTTTHPGLQAASLFSSVENGESSFYFGCSNAAGLFYKFNTGYNDASLGIYWDMRGPWEDEKRATILKDFHSYYLFVLGGGSTPYNTVTHTFEEDNDETVIKTKTAEVPATASLWNSGNWNSINWSSFKFKLLTFFPKRKAYFGRYGISNTYADQPFAVKGLARVTQPVDV